jgi:hypothetical protein
VLLGGWAIADAESILNQRVAASHRYWITFKKVSKGYMTFRSAGALYERLKQSTEGYAGAVQTRRKFQRLQWPKGEPPTFSTYS